MNEEQLNDAEPLESSTASMSIRPFQLVWKFKGLVALGVVIGAVLGVLYYVQARPVYQSAAQVLVIKKRPDALPLPTAEARASNIEDYLATHQVLIKSPLIVGAAIRDSKLQELESFASMGDPTANILENLKVVREIRENQPTNILNITYRGPHAADCAAVINAITESYRNFLNHTYQNVSDETARLIAQARDVLENKLAITEANYRKFRLEHPFLWKGKDGVSVIQDRLQSIETKRAGLLVRKTEIEARIAMFKKAIADQRPREELLAMVSQSSGRLASEAGKGSTVEDPLVEMVSKEEALREEFGRDHPQVLAIRKRIAFYRGQREQEGRSEVLIVDPVKGHVNLLEREAEDAQNAAMGLDKLLKSEQEEAKKLVRFENMDETYRTEILRTQQLFESISKRLTEVNLLKDFGGFETQVIAPAARGWKMGPRAIPVFGVACFLGLMAGFGMAYLAEVSDQSFRSPEEIRRQLGLPIVGHIPYFGDKDGLDKVDAENATLHPMLCTVHRSKSREAEAYRVVRTSLYFSSRGLGHKVIQVTSPDQGDGKSTLSSNLAVSIAQSGKSTLIIDADFRRPRIHKVFDVNAELGLASVIMGQAELDDVILPSSVPGLFVLPCGPIPNNPAELLTQSRLKELLGLLREKYDFVIVDTPPLLAVSDPSVVAPHVDGVILTVRISKNGRAFAKRAKDILLTLGANVLGVVVNGVGRDSQGYYGKYDYGYSYSSYEYVYGNSEYYTQENGEGEGDAHPPSSRRKGQGRKDGRFFSWLFNR